MKNGLVTVSMVLAMVSTPAILPSQAQDTKGVVKARIAVVPAIYAQGSRSKFERELMEKLGLSDLSAIENPGYTGHLINGLVNCRKFDVMEREALRAAVKELDFGESDYADSSKAVKLGKMLNAQYIVIPEIRFVLVVKEKRNVPFVGEQREEYSGTYGTSIRVVDVATGRIVSSSIAEASIKQRSAYRAADQIKQAVTFVDEMMAASARQETAKIIDVVYPITVVAIAGNQVTLNRGQGAIEEGETLKVYNTGDAIKDPQTGEILGRHEVEVGELKVVKVSPKMCIAEIVQMSPGVTLKVLDICRREVKKWTPPPPENPPKID